MCQIPFWLPRTEGLTRTRSAERVPAVLRVCALALPEEEGEEAREGGEGMACGAKHS